MYNHSSTRYSAAQSVYWLLRFQKETLPSKEKTPKSSKEVSESQSSNNSDESSDDVSSSDFSASYDRSGGESLEISEVSESDETGKRTDPTNGYFIRVVLKKEYATLIPQISKIFARKSNKGRQKLFASTFLENPQK